MEKPFYKRRWVLILAALVGFLLLFAGVTAATVSAGRRRAMSATPTPSPLPTQAPTPTPLPNYHALAFDPDLDRMEGMNAVGAEHREELGREWWVDVTPANADLPGYTLFRHVALGYSFLRLPDGRYLRLGERTDGCGVVNALFTDLDLDEGWELLYAYTAETEAGPAARVGWLDLTTLEDRSGAFLVKDRALALADDGGRVILYRASLQSTGSRGFYAIDFLAPLGELMERDGALFLEIE